MKFVEINKRYTEIVAECMAQGYTLNAGTMGGSQGEVAAIDLTNGQEIIRVMIENFFGFGMDSHSGCRIVVGRSTDGVIPNSGSRYGTVWSTNLEVLYTEVFYELGEGRYTGKEYGTLEQAEAAEKIRIARYGAKHEIGKERDAKLTAHGKDIAKRFLRRTLGKKRISSAEIEIKHRKNGGYAVIYKGSFYAMH